MLPTSIGISLPIIIFVFPYAFVFRFSSALLFHSLVAIVNRLFFLYETSFETYEYISRTLVNQSRTSVLFKRTIFKYRYSYNLKVLHRLLLFQLKPIGTYRSYRNDYHVYPQRNKETRKEFNRTTAII